MSINLDDILRGKHTVALSGHIRPDGDCVGSCMGMYLYLTEVYPELQVDVYLEKIPQPHNIIEKTDVIRHQIPEDMSYDLFICLDCGDKARLGFSGQLFENAKHTVCIDHHVSNRAFADENDIVPDASSTSELVYRLLDYDKISRACAEALYMGIAHDTGIFQYTCTAPETMEAAAALMRKGIDFNKILEKTYYEKTYVQNQILGKALLESWLILDGKCIVSAVSRKEMEFFNAEVSDMEGIVSQLRQTAGVEVAMFLYELETRFYRVSLRSKDYVDVSRVARYFGGGGHVKAAGLSMRGTEHDVINNVSGQIALQIESSSESKMI